MPACALIFAAMATLVPAGPSPDTVYHVPPLDPGIFLVEGSGAVLGGAICAAGFGYLLSQIYDPSEDVWKTFGGTVLGGSLGYPVFCGLGCYGAGKLVRQQGTWQGAVVGALAATPVALTVAWTATLVEDLPPGSVSSSPIYVIAALIPPAGAVAGYNLTRRNPPAQQSEVRILPRYAIGVDPGPDDTPSVAVRVGVEATF